MSSSPRRLYSSRIPDSKPSPTSARRRRSRRRTRRWVCWADILIGIAAVAGLSSVILVDIVAMACIGFALFRDGLLPPIFSRIHPGWGTPVLMTALTVGSVVLLSGLVTIEILAEMVSIGTLFAFDVVYFAYGYRKSRLARKEREEALK